MLLTVWCQRPGRRRWRRWTPLCGRRPRACLIRI